MIFFSFFCRPRKTVRAGKCFAKFRDNISLRHNFRLTHKTNKQQNVKKNYRVNLITFLLLHNDFIVHNQKLTTGIIKTSEKPKQCNIVLCKGFFVDNFWDAFVSLILSTFACRV